MTEAQLRQKVVDTMVGWLGYNEDNGKHKEIIDIYNAHKPLARGYKVKYTDEWCATAVSAAFIHAGLADIAPSECSCNKMIELYKQLGRWQEKDGYTPAVGDVIMYDWQDSGAGENTGAADHVGIVEKVSSKKITVIEGNKGEAVARRSLTVNGKYIRGYCLPDYASKASAAAPKKTTAAGNTVYVGLPILRRGSTGKTVEVMQRLLTAKGFSTQGIDGSFGQNTLAALHTFQNRAGLVVDGYCGKETWTALLTK